MQPGFMISSADDFSPVNLGDWSLRKVPSDPGNNRNEQLGFILNETLKQRTGTYPERLENVSMLETYCLQHPDDKAANAHLLRLCLIIGTIGKGPNSENLKQQADRLAQTAAHWSEIDPNNWYWRERQFHYFWLQDKRKQAIDALVAKPFPTAFEDYVDDDVRCRESLYYAHFRDLPRAAFIPIWTDTLIPHYSTFRQIEEAVKGDPNNLDLRVAQVHFGNALVNSCPTPIAGIVGERYLRHGIWGGTKASDDWKKLVNLKEEAKIRKAFLQSDSSDVFDRSLRIARDETHLYSLFDNNDLTLLYVGQFGPIFIAAGILAAIGAFAAYGLSRSKLKNLANENWGWAYHLGGILAPNIVWNSWRYLVNYTFANNYFVPILISCFLISCWMTWKSKEGLARIMLLTLLVFGLVVGLVGASLQASSTLFFLVFVFQRARLPLGPWTTAATIVLLGYHTAISMALAENVTSSLIAFGVSLAGILFVSNRKLDPDQPTLAPLTVGLATMIVGTFLMAQYDRGATTYFDSQKEVNVKLKAHFAKL